MNGGRGEKDKGGRVWLRALLFLLAFSLFPLSFAFPHPANVASSQAKVAPDGTFTIRIRFDLAAFATGASPKDADDGAMNGLLDGSDDALKAALADAETRFRSGFSGGGSVDRFEFPTVGEVRSFLASNPKPRLPVMMTATVTGRLPEAQRTISFRYPPTLDTVIQTVEFPYVEPISEPVEAGRASTTLTIPTEAETKQRAAEINAPRPAPPKTILPKTKPAEKKAAPPPRLTPDVEVISPGPKPTLQVKKPTLQRSTTTAKTAPPVVAKAPRLNPQTIVPLADTTPASAPQSTASTPVATYLRMGFTHILPGGLDHILFVLGLFLLGTRTKSLVTQITAFTVAHSITLALAALGLVRLPGSVIEPLIAASIAFVAIENLVVKDVKPWRPVVVFLFGLVHGLGFAEVFANAGLSGTNLVTALLGFNVGVELGQLTVVAAALGAIGWFRDDPRYRQWVVIPGSLLIGALAIAWTVQRTLGL